MLHSSIFPKPHLQAHIHLGSEYAALQVNTLRSVYTQACSVTLHLLRSDWSLLDTTLRIHSSHALEAGIMRTKRIRSIHAAVETGLLLCSSNNNKLATLATKK